MSNVTMTRFDMSGAYASSNYDMDAYSSRGIIFQGNVTTTSDNNVDQSKTYTTINVNRDTVDSDDEENSKFTSGKFSKLESEFIISRVHKFINDNNYKLEDIVNGIRDGNRMETGRMQILWHQLSREMQTRSAKSIYQHAHRKLLQGTLTPWTPEEKFLLHQLVEQKGKNWCVIAKILGKLGDDCKHMYSRSLKRARCGKFTLEENVELIQAIQQEMNLPLDLPLCHYPDKGIRWTNVTRRLGDERHNLDYLRRWATIKSKSIDSNKTLLTEIQFLKDVESTGAVYVEPRRQRVSIEENNVRTVLLLDYLADPKRGYNHDSQVKWAEIDRTFAFPYGYASHKWKVLAAASDHPRDMGFQEQIAYVRQKFDARSLDFKPKILH